MFRRGYRLGKCISFDKGMVPNRSQLNPMRVYMKDKPSKWGTKFYLTCCAETAYCSRIEVYCGKPANNQKEKNVGPKAVVRNITKVLHGQPAKRLVITDNYYSSVALSLKLHDIGFYHVGTVRTHRLGWCKPIQYKQKKRPKKMPRGQYKIVQRKTYPYLVALSWMDSRPVNMLATGCSTGQTTVKRKEKSGAITVTPCPQLVVDYTTGMGGVDVHDQIRLQRYSIQKCIRLRKYYKSLFLGVVDMAIVNGVIIHNVTQRKKGEKPPTHAAYMRRLHNELLGLRTTHFETNMNAEDLVSVPIPRQDHALVNNDTYYSSGTHSTRRQYLCKVCSAFADPMNKSFETSYHCPRCSEYFGGRVHLCRQVRRVESGNTLTCAQIWHDTWNDGKNIPPSLKKKIRFRKGKRKRTGAEEEEESS